MLAAGHTPARLVGGTVRAQPMSCEVKSYTQRWSRSAPRMPWVDYDLLSDLEYGGKQSVIIQKPE
jgi:hypothetical protein